MAVTYNPAIFETPDLTSAREIILTAEAGASSDERWARETPYLADLLGSALALQPGQMVVDYGCGVGRLSKALIERYDCLALASTAARRCARWPSTTWAPPPSPSSPAAPSTP